MGEFKAQILGIILVLGVFTLLNGKFKNFFENVWNGVQTQVTESLKENSISISSSTNS